MAKNAMAKRLEQAQIQKSKAQKAARAAKAELKGRPSKIATIVGSGVTGIGAGAVDGMAAQRGFAIFGQPPSLIAGGASALGAVLMDNPWLEVIASGTMAAHGYQAARSRYAAPAVSSDV
jgi:hypothetical protein